MADLFDMNVGGLGFHLTSHVIAIAALFIACFAIAGYITFRDDSIKRSALKDGPDDEGVLDRQGDVYTYRKVVNLAAHPANDVAAVVPLALAKDTMIIKQTLVMLDAGTGANAATTLDMYLHTSRLAAGDVGNTGNGATLLRDSGMTVDTQGNADLDSSPASVAAATVTQTEFLHLVYADNTAAAMTATPRVLVEVVFNGPEPVEAL